ncbi:ankyrin repeat domain-containing protein [Candidatus Venteria ishoeyi]|uniref:Ankyrin repeats (3 copies) n=1 Tax=Candidatus Venteria ishoeyi TaxID=1899563 RepID=A0A1H6F4N6_9GAMM|nr:ankyrin repeat domain-containing protein [Candidatus Venteria ishoeyi]SEH04523.1 Ankyrin repeats (3 copies) [Candidatus Venteria ishoeyi]
MSSKILPPYPTPVEIIRVLSNAFDTKLNNKTLDDQVSKLDTDYRVIRSLFSDAIEKPLKKYISDKAAQLLAGRLSILISNYLATVGKVALDGISRSHSVQLLAKYYFSNLAAEIVASFVEIIGGPHPVMMVASSDKAVDVTLNWLSSNEKGWNQFLSACSKEQKDRIAAWRKGQDLPSLQSIHLMRSWANESCPENIDWNRVKSLLIIARAIDWFRQYDLGSVAAEEARICLWSDKYSDNFATKAQEQQIACWKKFNNVFNIIGPIQHDLLRTSKKSKDAQRNLRDKLDNARKVLKRIDPEDNTIYWVDLHEARWHVLSGDLEKACKFYKMAFEGCLYRNGEQQKDIINEAVIVAASLKNPDKVFLKKLKNVAITFGYEIPVTSSIQGKKSNKTSEFIEDWEVNLWQSHFGKVFPKDGMFVDAVQPSVSAKIGPGFIDIESVKPDYRYPNRVIKVGETWKKSMPQIVFFTMIKRGGVVKKLLKKGAKLNVLSDSGESALLLALEALNVTEVPLKSLSDSLYKLLTRHEYKNKHKDIINTRTQKKRLLPIISAVESGRLDVVKKIISMGADPNGRGLTDEQSPLNTCLKHIGTIKYPARFLHAQNTLPTTPELLDGNRRHSAGLSGYTLEHQAQCLAEKKNNRLFNSMMERSNKLMIDRMAENMSLDTMHEIAKVLLDAGADPNAEHMSPVKGYTPLMLAAELNEQDLFKAMLNKGGDPFKTYFNPTLKQEMDCQKIAHAWHAQAVLDVLK